MIALFTLAFVAIFLKCLYYEPNGVNGIHEINGANEAEN